MKGKKEIRLPQALTVRQLAERMGVDPIPVIKTLMRHGIMAGLNNVIDYEKAALVASQFGFTPSPEEEPEKLTLKPQPKVKPKEGKVPRPPVIVVMGHVDHGKTTLLDYIRKTNVAETEPGAITQHIGAYQVEYQGKKITFIDTPGHEAFTALRARGAEVTDIAILVVAADEGVMPQTREAISHARAADVPIIVAINKMDKPNADPEKVKRQLAEEGLVIEEWGGDTVCVEISAKTGQGIPELLEYILLVAELQDLKADPSKPAVGTIIEARLDRTRGPVATVLVQDGTLRVGDVFVAGTTWGKVKALFDDRGQRVKEAPPSMPVEVLGAETVPEPGDVLRVVADEREAHKILEQKRREAKAPSGISLEEIAAQIHEGREKVLNVILKTDVQGSILPIKTALERMSEDDVRLHIVHAAPGNITVNDVMLAIASRSIIIGFNTYPTSDAKKLANAEKVDIRCFQVIYHLVEDIERVLKGLKEPVFEDQILGHAEVRAIFDIGRGKKVAGVYVRDGKAVRDSIARIIRNGQVIYEAPVESMKHFKEHVQEMPAGTECGVGVQGFSDFEEGDIIEFYRRVRKR